MKQIKFLVIIFICTICTANKCKKDDCHNVIPFTNNSDETLYVYSKRTPPFDTILGLGSGFFTNHNYYKILPNSISKRCVSMRPKNCFDSFPKIIIFILDESAEEILQRYDLTPTDLQQLNWEVPYPPDERMKNMKMYPPYSNE